MNTNPQQYPTQFYGRTWRYWLATLFFVLPAVSICCITAIMMLLGAVGIIHNVKSFGDSDVIYGMIIFIFFILLAIALIFRLCALQCPVLKIHREGLWIRTIGTSTRIDPLLGCVLGVVFALLFKAFMMVWSVITLQLFCIRIVRLQWENITDIQDESETLIKRRKFMIAGLYEKEYNDFSQGFSLEHYTISYDAEDFSVSIAVVNESVQFFLHNPDAREFLPSWQDEETLLGNDTFDFR